MNLEIFGYIGTVLILLSFLIENPSEFNRIGKNAIQFINKEHHYVNQAEKYVGLWKTN